MLAAVLVLCAPVQGANAQSLFQTLFGNLFSSAPKKAVPPPGQPAGLGPPSRSAYDPIRNYTPRYEPTSPSSSGGAFRTVCVRSCDGYYFPVSGSASPSKFHKDAESCSARCSGGRLYYLPKNSEDMAAMVDLDGHRYDELRNAFLYRTKLINGCSCRPMPWSAAERARHNRYAYAAEILKRSEERARDLREGKIAEIPGGEATSPVRQPDDAKESAPEGDELDAGPTDGATASGEATGSAHLAAIEPVMADQSGASIAAVDAGRAGAETVSFSPRRSSKTSRPVSAKPRRTRETRRKPGPSNGWPFAGGGKYRWPGDR